MNKIANIKDKIIILTKNDLVIKCILFVVTLLILSVSIRFNDPDYYWHYKAGEIFTETGNISKVDIFSYSMPDFMWINHEWLSDVFIYNIENTLGKEGLAIVFFLISLLTAIIFLSKKKRLNFVDVIIFILSFSVLISFIGIRPQIFSFLFLSILFFIFEKIDKYWWLPPLIFLTWSNLHGGFFLGLTIFLLYMAYKIYNSIKNKEKLEKNIIYSFLLSLLLTTINPYGINIYIEIFRTIGDTELLNNNINEWRTFFLHPNLRYVLIIGILLPIITLMGKRILKIKDIIFWGAVTILLFLISIKSIKYIPYSVLIILFMTYKFSDVLLEEWQKLKNNFITFFRASYLNKMFMILFFALVLLAYIKPTPILSNQSKLTTLPSKDALDKINVYSSKNIFSEYGWGGYLIRYSPQNKIFIDGRMPSWKENNLYAFKDYLDIKYCRNIPVLDKYNTQIIFLSVSDDKCGLIDKVKELQYKEVFKDKTAIILEKSGRGARAVE